MNALEKLNDN